MSIPDVKGTWIICPSAFLCYNSLMLEMLFTFSSHLIFIYFSFYLLNTAVNWGQFLRMDPDNARRSRLLILFLSIALGYLVSLFFLSIYNMSRDIFLSTF